MKRVIGFLLLAAIVLVFMSCKSSQSPDDTGRVDTVWVALDTVWLEQLTENSYYWLFCQHTDGCDTLAHLWLKHIEYDDTCENGWSLITFATEPESTFHNAQDFFLSHAPRYGR